MSKFELSFGQYVICICHELNTKLSSNCKIVVHEDNSVTSLKAIAKDYPEYDSIKITYGDWSFRFDTIEIEKAYKREINIQTMSDTILGDLKKEFVKQLLNN